MQETLCRIIEAAKARSLPLLLIGGHAVILYGFARNTIDIDVLVPAGRRSAWLDLMRELGFHFYHGTAAFAQFEPEDKSITSVDLMFVDDHTWNVLSETPITKSLAGHEVQLPRPEHLVALKLHAAKGPDHSKPELDWEDIRQIVRICGLDIADPGFRDIVRPLWWRTSHSSHRIIQEMKTDAKKAAFEPFDLPVFDVAQVEPRTGIVSWEAVMRETESVRRYYLHHFDTPEKRLRDKNPEPFHMD